MSPTPAVVLTVAGTDSGGAAGVAADLTTFSQLGVHGACVVTAVTAQDTTAVHAVHPVPVDVVEAQLAAVFDDLPVASVKTGMLGSAQVVELVAEWVERRGVPLVVDPVLVATSGAVLGDEGVVAACRSRLLPVATVATPNADEACALTGRPGSPAELAEALCLLGPTVVVTGGERGRDWLARPGHSAVPLDHRPVDTRNDHGTGCTHSAALAAYLALGLPLEEAVTRAGELTARQLRASSDWVLGRGRGPVAHTQPVHAHPRGSTTP